MNRRTSRESAVILIIMPCNEWRQIREDQRLTLSTGLDSRGATSFNLVLIHFQYWEFDQSLCKVASLTSRICKIFFRTELLWKISKMIKDTIYNALQRVRHERMKRARKVKNTFSCYSFKSCVHNLFRFLLRKRKKTLERVRKEHKGVWNEKSSACVSLLIDNKAQIKRESTPDNTVFSVKLVMTNSITKWLAFLVVILSNGMTGVNGQVDVFVQMREHCSLLCIWHQEISFKRRCLRNSILLTRISSDPWEEY